MARKRSHFAEAILLVGATAGAVWAEPPVSADQLRLPDRVIDLALPPTGTPTGGTPTGTPIVQIPVLPIIGGGLPVAPHTRAPLSADAGTLVTGNNSFALDMYRRLAADTDADENLLLSPFSVSAALGMTYAGARNRTAQQMADVLGFSLPDDRLHAAFGELLGDLTAERDGYELHIANRLFGQSDYPFQQRFVETTGRDYGAPLEPVDYRRDYEVARLRINDWVEEQTQDKIRNLLPKGSINESARLVLTNAIYFDGSWKHEFDESATWSEQFYSSGRATDVEMMHQLHSFAYAEQPGFQILEMPYAGDDLSLVALLPTERDGLAELEASLTPEVWESGIAALRHEQVSVALPKFKFDSAFNLAGQLKAMGMSDAFDGELADLTGIAEPLDEKLAIDKVLHKAFIDVNETGTEAAAATAVTIIAVTGAFFPPQPPKEFRADHPFLFALRDRHSGSVLFFGRVTNPGALAASSVAETAAAPEPGSAALLVIGLVLGSSVLGSTGRRGCGAGLKWGRRGRRR